VKRTHFAEPSNRHIALAKALSKLKRKFSGVPRETEFKLKWRFSRIEMAGTKKPKVQIKRQKVSLGWAYRIYVDGMYECHSENLLCVFPCFPIKHGPLQSLEFMLCTLAP